MRAGQSVVSNLPVTWSLLVKVTSNVPVYPLASIRVSVTLPASDSSVWLATQVASTRTKSRTAKLPEDGVATSLTTGYSPTMAGGDVFGPVSFRVRVASLRSNV